MATRRDDVQSTSVLAALGGTVSNTDDVFFEKSVGDFTSGGNLSAADLTSFQILAGCRAKFAVADGGGLQLVVNQAGAGVFTDESSSPRVDLRSTSATGVIATIICRKPSGLLRVDECDTETCIVQSGNAILAGNCDCANLIVDGGKVDALNGSYALTTLRQKGGVCNLARDVASAYLGGGQQTWEHEAISPGSVLEMTGGTLIVKRCGTVTQLNGYAGVLDISQLQRPFTITAATLHPGFTIRRKRSQIVMTISSATRIGGGERYVYVD